MGILIPENFPMRSLANDDERAVVEALRDRLSDSWCVMPDVGLAGQRDRQIDVVIAHEEHGVAVIEVKGHRAELRAGYFQAGSRPLAPQPHVQARDNAYALRDLLRQASPALEHLRVEYAVVLPNTGSLRGALPPGLLASQVMTGASFFDDPADAVDRLMSARWGNQPIGREGFDSVVRTIRPDAELDWDEAAQARRARRRMDGVCAERVRTLESLDANRKVLVTGGAGSGKTLLGTTWARRAIVRGERVLMTCYNDPLGEDLARRLKPVDGSRVGAFFRIALGLDGIPPLAIPDDADGAWWDTVAVGHLLSHWPSATERFDVVIVDEAQDFSPAWLALLEQLLDPRGCRGLIWLADEAQGVFRRGFALPSSDDGWTRCSLADNCRNTFGVASILHRYLDGAVPMNGPESLGVRWREPGEVDELVGEEIDRIEADGYRAHRVLIATTSRATRDRLRQHLAFAAWDAHDEQAYVCETVHRVKGLEFDFVVLVADEDITDLLLYVGLSRAVIGFSLVAPASVAARLGLVEQDRRP